MQSMYFRKLPVSVFFILFFRNSFSQLAQYAREIFIKGFPNVRSVLLICMADRTAGLQAQKNYWKKNRKKMYLWFCFGYLLSNNFGTTVQVRWRRLIQKWKAQSKPYNSILGVDKYFFMMMVSGCMHTHCMLITFLMERGACMHPLVIIM
jgi:hypothetical protein